MAVERYLHQLLAHARQQLNETSKDPFGEGQPQSETRDALMEHLLHTTIVTDRLSGRDAEHLLQRIADKFLRR